MPLRVPSSDELRDADLREQFLAEVMVAVAAGELDSRTARCLRDLAKEMRDNTDVRWMTRIVQRGQQLFKELLARKGGITPAEVEGYCERWLRDAGDE